jgi:hypothetical protein
MEVNGQVHAAASLALVLEAPVSIGQEARWAPEPVWKLRRSEKSIAPAENRTLVVQPTS